MRPCARAPCGEAEAAQAPRLQGGAGSGLRCRARAAAAACRLRQPRCSSVFTRSVCGCSKTRSSTVMGSCFGLSLCRHHGVSAAGTGVFRSRFIQPGAYHRSVFDQTVLLYYGNSEAAFVLGCVRRLSYTCFLPLRYLRYGLLRRKCELRGAGAAS